MSACDARAHENTAEHDITDQPLPRDAPFGRYLDVFIVVPVEAELAKSEPTLYPIDIGSLRGK